MTTLECECGFSVDDGLDLAIIMFAEHRKTCKVWAKKFEGFLRSKK